MDCRERKAPRHPNRYVPELIGGGMLILNLVLATLGAAVTISALAYDLSTPIGEALGSVLWCASPWFAIVCLLAWFRPEGKVLVVTSAITFIMVLASSYFYYDLLFVHLDPQNPIFLFFVLPSCQNSVAVLLGIILLVGSWRHETD